MTSSNLKLKNNKINFLRIGTRTSNLALAQVAEIHLMIAEHFPDIKIEIVTITTSGDKIKEENLAKFGGKGLFIKELEEALIDDKIDLAIHSAKDVPPQVNNATEIVAFTQRLDPRDCLISHKYKNINDLPKNATIGTSSPRRKAMLLKHCSDLKIINFRGNVDTRLRKALEEGLVDATILAVAGLERLGKNQLIQQAINIDEMLPAGGQGSLAIQIRKDHDQLAKMIAKINHRDSSVCIQAERAFLQELGASCNSAVGVYGEIKNKKLFLKTMILDQDGQSYYQVQGDCKAELENAVKLAIKLANQTKKEAKELYLRVINS